MTVTFCQGIITFPATYDDECNSMKIWWSPSTPWACLTLYCSKHRHSDRPKPEHSVTVLNQIVLCELFHWESRWLGWGRAGIWGFWPCCRQVTPSSCKIGIEAFLQVTVTLQGRLLLNFWGTTWAVIGEPSQGPKMDKSRTSLGQG